MSCHVTTGERQTDASSSARQGAHVTTAVGAGYTSNFWGPPPRPRPSIILGALNRRIRKVGSVGFARERTREQGEGIAIGTSP